MMIVCISLDTDQGTGRFCRPVHRINSSIWKGRASSCKRGGAWKSGFGRVFFPSSSGSDQAQEGRLVDALAIRGDEGRDTLR